MFASTRSFINTHYTIIRCTPLPQRHTRVILVHVRRLLDNRFDRYDPVHYVSRTARIVSGARLRFNDNTLLLLPFASAVVAVRVIIIVQRNGARKHVGRTYRNRDIIIIIPLLRFIMLSCHYSSGPE